MRGRRANQVFLQIYKFTQDEEEAEEKKPPAQGFAKRWGIEIKFNVWWFAWLSGTMLVAVAFPQWKKSPSLLGILPGLAIAPFLSWMITALRRAADFYEVCLGEPPAKDRMLRVGEPVLAKLRDAPEAASAPLVAAAAQEALTGLLAFCLRLALPGVLVFAFLALLTAVSSSYFDKYAGSVDWRAVIWLAVPTWLLMSLGGTLGFVCLCLHQLCCARGSRLITRSRIWLGWGAVGIAVWMLEPFTLLSLSWVSAPDTYLFGPGHPFAIAIAVPALLGLYWLACRLSQNSYLIRELVGNLGCLLGPLLGSGLLAVLVTVQVQAEKLAKDGSAMAGWIYGHLPNDVFMSATLLSWSVFSPVNPAMIFSGWCIGNTSVPFAGAQLTGAAVQYLWFASLAILLGQIGLLRVQWPVALKNIAEGQREMLRREGGSGPGKPGPSALLTAES